MREEEPWLFLSCHWSEHGLLHTATVWSCLAVESSRPQHACRCEFSLGHHLPAVKHSSPEDSIPVPYLSLLHCLGALKPHRALLSLGEGDPVGATVHGTDSSWGHLSRSEPCPGVSLLESSSLGGFLFINKAPGCSCDSEAGNRCWSGRLCMWRRFPGAHSCSLTDLEAFTRTAFAPLVRSGFCWENLASRKKTP